LGVLVFKKLGRVIYMGLFRSAYKALAIVTNAVLQALGRQPLALTGCADTIRPFHGQWLWLLS
jgi:hypothetical protein